MNTFISTISEVFPDNFPGRAAHGYVWELQKVLFELEKNIILGI